MKYLYFKNKVDYTHTAPYDAGKFHATSGALHPSRHLSFFVLLIGSSGQFDIAIDDVAYALLPNTYLLLPPDYKHYGTRMSGPNLTEYYVNFTIQGGYSLIDEAEALAHATRIAAEKSFEREFVFPLHAEIEAIDRFQLMLNSLIETHNIEGLYKNMICDHILNVLMAILSQNFIDSVVVKQNVSENYKKVHHIMKWINTNATRITSIPDMANRFNYTPNYLTGLFKSTIGVPLVRYINEQKIAEACRLLLNTDLSVKEIAFSCGFHDSKYFSRVFKAQKGIEPSKYRNAYFDIHIKAMP